MGSDSPLLSARRQLTILFCDLVNSTGLSQQIDPEDLYDVLHAYHEACAEVVGHFDGYVAQYLGDGLLIYFGYPQAQEDAALRAVRTGLGIVEALHALNARLEKALGIRLAVRVGLHTGLVVVSDLTSDSTVEQLAFGATPNIAARLQGLAEANTVVLSSATYQLIQGYFTCQELGVHTLPGVASPMRVYRVLQASGAQTRLDITPPWHRTPFVGRAEELALLRQRWAQAQGGTGQVVWLCGEAGIGKSRLVQAVKAEIASGEVMRFECRCSPYYRNTALYPLIDCLQQRLAWRDDTLNGKLKKLEALVARCDVPQTEAVPLLAKLLSLPLPAASYAPLTLTPQEQRQKTFETLLAIFLAPSAAQPVLFVVEDLHWSDPSTLAFLGFLLERAARASMLTILTSRPTLPLPLAARPHLTAITLHRLSPAHVEAMLPGMTRGKQLPAEVTEQLMVRADGIPLFVEELTKAVLASELLQEAEDRYELRQLLPPLAIPATLQDSLMARLDGLANAKPIAQLAATIGRRFSYDVLRAVSPWDEDTLQDGLRQLVEAELCYQHRVLPQATYCFKHALIQEAAYESLLKRQRQRYHQQIAQVLEQRFPETAAVHPELVAHHYTQAALPRQAVAYWQRAGQKAVERVALLEAVVHQRQGLDVLATLPETPARDRQELALQLALGPTLMMARSFTAPEVEQAFARARALSHKLGDKASLFQALRGLCRVYHIRRELRTAHELVQACLHLVQPHGDPDQLIEAHKLMGIILALRGALAPARQHFEHGLAVYKPGEHRRLIDLYGEDPGVVCLARLAYVLWQMGYPEQARQRMQAALALATGHEHAPSVAYVLNHAARLFQLRREPDIARDHTAAAIAVAHVRGLAPWYTAPLAIWRGWALVAQDQQEAGQLELRQGLAEWEARGMQGVSPYFLALWAETYGYMGDAAAGQRVLAHAFEVVERTEERAEMARLQALKGELYGMQGEASYPVAERCFQDALSLARQQQAKSLELRAAMGLSRLWRQRGKREDAHLLVAGIYGGFTEGLDTADLRDARSLLADLERR